MIEFNGYLTGEARKRFEKKSFCILFGFLTFADIVSLPGYYFVGSIFKQPIAVPLFFIAILGAPIVLFFLRSEKEKKSELPRRIVINEDTVFVTTDKNSESKLINDIKKVIDNGTYYEMVFPFGKSSQKFICQKEFLIKGSLDEFELLFEDKIIRKN